MTKLSSKNEPEVSEDSIGFVRVAAAVPSVLVIRPRRDARGETIEAALEAGYLDSTVQPTNAAELIPYYGVELTSSFPQVAHLDFT
jgi:hypothetical protein